MRSDLLAKTVFRLAGLLVCLWAASARAQYVPYGPFEVYPSMQLREGPGFKVLGDGLVIHPGLAAELGYDSNVLMAAQAGGAGVLRLRAHVDLATRPPQRLEPESRPFLKFRFGAAVEYRQFFSRDPRVGYPQQVNAQSDADLRIKEHDPLSFRIYNQFLVTNDARNLEVANTQTFAPRIFDRLTLLATYRPYGGPLEIGLSESIRLDHYIQSELSPLRSFENHIALWGSYRLLPQTLLRLEVRSSFTNFYGDGAVVPNSAPLRITAGIQSLFLSWLAGSVYLGYGNSLHFGVTDATPLVGDKADARYNNFVGGIEARLLFVERMKLRLGWARDFFDSIYATYLKDDRLYLAYEHNPWKALQLTASFETYFRTYGPLVAPSTLYYRAYKNGAQNRSDILLSLGVQADYRFLSWLSAGVSYNLLADLTDFGFVDGAGTRMDAGFQKHVVLFKADVAY